MKFSRENTKTLWILSILVFSSGFLGLGISFYADPILFIESPRLGAPDFVSHDDNFEIDIRWAAFQSFKNPVVSISNEWGVIILNHKIIQDLSQFKKLEASINSSIPEGLYDLTVKVGNLIDTEYHSIKILKKYPNHIRFAHFADLHLEVKSPERTILWDTAIKELNLLNPDFVLVTGDITELARKAEWDIFEKSMMLATFPIYCIIGNHDVGDPNEFYERFAPLNYSFSIGTNFHFTTFNTGDKTSGPQYAYPALDWFKADLETHKDIPIKFIATHIPLFETDSMSPYGDYHLDMHDLIDLYDIEGCFAGHEHDNRVVTWNQTPIFNFPHSEPLYIETSSLGKSGIPSYRWLEANTTHGLSRVSYDKNGVGKITTWASTPVNSLTWSTNSTINQSKTATILLNVSNKLYESYSKCKFDFEFPADSNVTYTSSVGIISVIYRESTKNVVRVLFDIAANKTSLITVIPSGGKLIV
jgi:Calcineurin-like phosphoesterase